MRVGNGILSFGDSQVTWNDKPILEPPSKGSYQLFFYANGPTQERIILISKWIRADFNG